MSVHEQAKSTVYLDGKQAGQEMKKLEGHAAKLKKELVALRKANDMTGFNKKKKELDQVNRQMKQLKKETFDVSKVMRNLSTASLNDLYKAQRKLNAEVRKTSRNTKEFTDKSAQLKKVKAEIAKVRTEMSGVGQRSNALSRSFAKLGPMVLAAFSFAAIKGFITNLINVRKEFEKYQAVLENSLGSIQEARMEMNMLKKFAAETPFSLQQLTESYVKLVNQGFQPTKEEMRKLGDLAASTGKEMDQLAEAVIDAMVGENERLKEFGIRGEKHGDKIIYTFKGIKTEVDFTSEAIQDYILSLGDMEGVSGSMAKISETLGGRISNLGDAWDNMLNQLGSRTGGVFFTVINWLTKLVSNIEMAAKSINQLKQEVADTDLKRLMIEDVKEIEGNIKRLKDKGIEQAKAEQSAIKMFKNAIQTRIRENTKALTNQTEEEQTATKQLITEYESRLNAAIEHYRNMGITANGHIEVQEKTTKKVDAEHANRLLEIKKRYAAQLIDKQTYDRKVQNEEIEHLKAVIKIKQNANESVVKEEQKLLDIKIKMNESAVKDFDFTTSLEQAHQERITILKQQYYNDLLSKKEFDAEMLLEEITYLEALSQLKRKHGEDTYREEQQLYDLRINLKENYDQIVKSSLDDMQTKITDDNEQLMDLLMQEVQAEIDLEIEKK